MVNPSTIWSASDLKIPTIVHKVLLCHNEITYVCSTFYKILKQCQKKWQIHGSRRYLEVTNCITRVVKFTFHCAVKKHINFFHVIILHVCCSNANTAQFEVGKTIHHCPLLPLSPICKFLCQCPVLQCPSCLAISAFSRFLPLDTMLAWCMPCTMSLCPSVCHKPVMYQKSGTYHHIISAA